jgi:ASC-1-like (ASCH) protein
MVEIGINTEILNTIRDGRKTVEGRLARDKFLSVSIGDIISVREDVYVDAAIQTSHQNALRIKVTDVQKYDTFRSMLQTVGFKNAIPDATSLDEACTEYLRYYPELMQKEYGVLAISFEVLTLNNN